TNFGSIYGNIIQKVEQTKQFWDKQIPQMIQCYFEDMKSIFLNLHKCALPESQIWIIVSNSAYYGIEIPVDLILAEIGSEKGWVLKEIKVLRHIHKRVTRNSPEIKSLRESLIIFKKKSG